MSIEIRDFVNLGQTWKEIYERFVSFCPSDDPLEFFQLVVDDAVFFEANYKDYITVNEYFRKPELTSEYRGLYFIAVQNCILELPDYWEITKGEYCQSYELIYNEAVQRLLSMPSHQRSISNAFNYNFSEVNAYLEKYPDNQDAKETISNLRKKALADLISSDKITGPRIQRFIGDCDQALHFINSKKESQFADQKENFKPKAIASYKQAEIALIHYYGSLTKEMEAINRANSNAIANLYGFTEPNSGFALMRMVRKTTDSIWRYGFSGANKNEETNKKKRLEIAIDHLQQNGSTRALAIANKELGVFLKEYNRKYGN